METFAQLFSSITGFEVEEPKYNESIWVLCGNKSGIGWKAKAVWTHKPTFEDIMKLNSFADNRNRKLENIIVNKIIENNSVRILYEDYGPDNYNSWFEYMLVNPLETGDLNLFDYLQTGYHDIESEKYCVRVNEDTLSYYE